jgi:hypothetical protein
VIFKFDSEPSFIEKFSQIWKNRYIPMNGVMHVKKSIVENVKSIDFEFSNSCLYYTYNDFTLCDNINWNPSRMLFMMNRINIEKKSIMIENLQKMGIKMTIDKDDLLDRIVFHNTSTILGD